MARTRKMLSSDTVEVQSSLINERFPAWPSIVPLPGDATHREEVLARFSAFLQFRAAKDWPLCDVIVLAKMSRIAFLHDLAITDIEQNGLTALGGRRGDTPVKSPSVEVAQSLGSQMLALMRSLKLSTDSNDARAIQRHGAKSRELAGVRDGGRDSSGLLGLGTHSLLA
jgi:hypothetical protein